MSADFTCYEAGWRPLPSGWRRGVITIQSVRRCWRCTSTDKPPNNSAMKWRLNASAWPYINPPRGSVTYFLSWSGWFCDPIGCKQTSVKKRTRPPSRPVGTYCSVTYGHKGTRRRTAPNCFRFYILILRNYVFHITDEYFNRCGEWWCDVIQFNALVC